VYKEIYGKFPDQRDESNENKLKNMIDKFVEDGLITP
jgi:hypothetical protein